MLDRRSTWWLRVVGRLKPGESLEKAQAGMRAIQPQYASHVPAELHGQRPRRLSRGRDARNHVDPAATGPSEHPDALSHGAPDADRRGRARAADRLRQSRQPAARAGIGASKRVRGAAGAGRVARAARASIADGEPDARGRRRRARFAVRAVGEPPDRRADVERAVRR